jgi:peroxin-3
MSQSSANQQQLQPSSRRKGGRRTSLLPSLATVAAAGAVAVGTYQLAKWAWGAYEESSRRGSHTKQRAEQQEQQQEPAAATRSFRGAGDDDSKDESDDDASVEEEEDLVIEESIAESGDNASSHQGHVRFLLPGRGGGSGAPNENGPKAASSRPTASRNGGGRDPAASSKRAGLGPAQWKVRDHRLARCRGETAAALSGFLASVRRIVDDRTDTLAETKELKRLRAHRGGVGGGGAAAAGGGSSPTGKGGGADGGAGAAGGVSRLLYASVAREKELWERIKVRSVTRVVASAYAHTVLFLVLTVQVNLLGGRLFEDQVFGPGRKEAEASDEEADRDAERRMASYQASHRFVLTHTYEPFFARGLAGLVDAVEGAASEALAGWNVLEPSSLRFTLEEFEEGIRRVRALVGEGPAGSGSPTPSSSQTLLRFLQPPPAAAAGSAAAMPSPGTDEGGDANGLARSILDETWDLLESPVFEDALESCLSKTFDMMRDLHWGTVFEEDGGCGGGAPSQSPAAAVAADEGSNGPPAHVTRPLATVLTKLKKTAGSFYEGSLVPVPVPGSEAGAPPPATAALPGPYCAALERLPAVLELADVSFS